jgi:molybdopterin biosynthesis enzyme
MRIATIGCIALLVACARTEEEPAMDTAAGAADVATATAISLAEVAGRWDVTSTPESGTDTSVTRYTLTATPEMTGWTITFANRPQAVPVRVVAVDGDSIVTEAGPFESVRRKGIQVTTRNVLRKQGDRLTGTTRARYQSSGADTVLTLRTEGMRAP